MHWWNQNLSTIILEPKYFSRETLCTTTETLYHSTMLVQRVKDMEGQIMGLRIKPILLMDLVTIVLKSSNDTKTFPLLQVSTSPGIRTPTSTAG